MGCWGFRWPPKLVVRDVPESARLGSPSFFGVSFLWATGSGQALGCRENSSSPSEPLVTVLSRPASFTPVFGAFSALVVLGAWDGDGGLRSSEGFAAAMWAGGLVGLSGPGFFACRSVDVAALEREGDG